MFLLPGGAALLEGVIMEEPELAGASGGARARRRGWGEVGTGR